MRASSSPSLSAFRTLSVAFWIDSLTCDVRTSYETVVKRWPIILTSTIDNIYRVNHQLCVAQSEEHTDESVLAAAKVEEGKGLIEQISKLKYDMGRDRPLEWVVIDNRLRLGHSWMICRRIPDDGEALVQIFNTELARLTEQGKGTWFTAPWLYAE